MGQVCAVGSADELPARWHAFPPSAGWTNPALGAVAMSSRRRPVPRVRLASPDARAAQVTPNDLAGCVDLGAQPFGPVIGERALFQQRATARIRDVVFGHDGLPQE